MNADLYIDFDCFSDADLEGMAIEIVELALADVWTFTGLGLEIAQ